MNNGSEEDFVGSAESILMAMIKHIDAMNHLSKSLEDSQILKQIERQGQRYKEKHLADEPYYWRGADIQIIYSEPGSGLTQWQASTTQVGWGHEEPCPTTYPVFLAGLINRIQEEAWSYLDSMSKYFWYGRIAETAQRVASRTAAITKKEFAREIIFQQISATNELKDNLLEHIKTKSGNKTLYEQGWRLYFAYGKNVNRRDMLHKDRAPNAKFVMADYVNDHKFIIDNRGVASIVKSPGSRVWGILWSISPEDIARLDLREGVAKGIYRKETINTAMWTASAHLMSGFSEQQAQALVYISNSPEGTKPRENYIEGIIEGLREALVAEDEFAHYQGFIAEVSQSKNLGCDTQPNSKPSKAKHEDRVSGNFLPADPSLPFFAYGIFKQGELGFERIATLKRFVESASLNGGVLLERDGLPLLMDCSDPDNSDAIESLGAIPSSLIKGDIIIFDEGRGAEAYGRIAEIEPENHYRWAVVEIAQTDNAGEICKANTLVAKNPKIGTKIMWAESWSVRDDLFYQDVIDLCQRQISETNNPIEKQAALLMAWSAIERVCAIKYSLKKGSVEKVKMLGSDEAFKTALKLTEEKLGQKHPFRPIQDTRDTKSKNSYRFLFSHSIDAAKYLYQIRNNISHRGKAGYEEDVPIINASLEILTLTLQKLLNIGDISLHQRR